MIQKESWHVEIASLEEERERLYRAVQRGIISPEEFTHKMLRLWSGDSTHVPSQFEHFEVKVYPPDEDDPQEYKVLQVTREWVYHHSPLVNRMRRWYDAMVEWRGSADPEDTYGYDWDDPSFRQEYDEDWAEASLRRINEWDEVRRLAQQRGMDDPSLTFSKVQRLVWTMRPGEELKSGNDPQFSQEPFGTRIRREGFQTEAEFNAYAEEVLQEAEAVVNLYGEVHG